MIFWRGFLPRLFYCKTITRMIPNQGQRSLTSYEIIVDTPPETNLVIQDHKD